MLFSFIKELFGKSEKTLGELAVQKKNDPRLINTENAQTVVLPRLKTMNEYQEKFTERNQSYWEIYNRGYSHYKRGWYEKAADEFLKIYDQNPDQTYFTHLLRTYRKIIKAKQAKKRYYEALTFSDELFDRCKNFTNSDIRIHNKLIDLVGIDRQRKELLEEHDKPEYLITGNYLKHLSDGKKPRGFKVENPYQEINPYRIEQLRQTLWPPLPHIKLEKDQISYAPDAPVVRKKGIAYRVKSVIGNSGHFVYSTDDVELRLATTALDTIHSLDCTKFAGDKYHLRCVDMTPDMSLIVFTVTDECFLLDEKLNILKKWRVPYKIDTASGRYARRSMGHSSYLDPDDFTWALNTLGISKTDPTTKEIKDAFRTMTKKYHPDRSDDLEAEEMMKDVIRAYEYIRTQDISGIDTDELEDEYWVEILHRDVVGFGGFSVQIEMSMGIDPSDWIYGTGMSADGQRIYLACYSGKIYEISPDGVAGAIYEMTTQESVETIIECDNFLYVLTISQLYVIDRIAKKFVKAIQTRGEALSSRGYIRFYEGGFVHIQDHNVVMYDAAGNEQCNVYFDSSPKYVFLSPNGQLIVETGKKLHLFGRKPS